MPKGKMSGSHRTRIPEVETLYRALQKSSNIKKFGMGVIGPAKSCSEPRVKMTDETGALRLHVRGRIATQILWVYSDTHWKARIDIRNALAELKWELKEP